MNGVASHDRGWWDHLDMGKLRGTAHQSVFGGTESGGNDDADHFARFFDYGKGGCGSKIDDNTVRLESIIGGGGIRDEVATDSFRRIGVNPNAQIHFGTNDQGAISGMSRNHIRHALG